MGAPLLLLLPLFFAAISPPPHASAVTVVEASSPPLVGAWEPIKDVNDRHILDIASFAVSEHNKERNASLVLVKVLRGWSQVVNGFRYSLQIEARDGQAIAKYRAEVLTQAAPTIWQLNSFVRPIVGRWVPIPGVNDAHIIDIAKFAVTEHNKKQKATLVFIKVLRGWTQVVAGVNYRLLIEANDGKAVANYEAVVWEKAWENFRQLTSFKRLHKKA